MQEDIEIWRDIPGYEGYYQVSNLGRVRSLDRVIKRSTGVFSKKHSQILKPRDNGNGYMYVNLSKNGKYKSVTVHRLVAKAFLEKKPDKNQVNHIDGNKANNNVSNLEWTDRYENMQHAFKTGLNKPRIHEQHHAAKLTEEDVGVIRDRYHKGESIVSISKSYPQVSYECVKGVCARRYWV